MLANAIGAQFRRYEDRLHDGKAARVVIASRVYDTDREDLWNALTTAERIPRWFLPIEGDLRLGGKYQLTGNAGGEILHCVPPEAFEITWVMPPGGASWVIVRLTPQANGTLLTLEHIVHAEDVEQFWAQFGPGAVGVGWDGAFMGMGRHIASGGARIDPAEFQAWSMSEEGKTFNRACALAWGEAHIAGGEDPEVARAMAHRVAAFYTGG